MSPFSARWRSVSRMKNGFPSVPSRSVSASANVGLSGSRACRDSSSAVTSASSSPARRMWVTTCSRSSAMSMSRERCERRRRIRRGTSRVRGPARDPRGGSSGEPAAASPCRPSADRRARAGPAPRRSAPSVAVATASNIRNRIDSASLSSSPTTPGTRSLNSGTSVPSSVALRPNRYWIDSAGNACT